MNEKIDCRSSLGAREMKEVDGGDEVSLIDVWETKSGSREDRRMNTLNARPNKRGGAFDSLFYIFFWLYLYTWYI